jgi:hypothetical protein
VGARLCVVFVPGTSSWHVNEQRAGSDGGLSVVEVLKDPHDHALEDWAQIANLYAITEPNVQLSALSAALKGNSARLRDFAQGALVQRFAAERPATVFAELSARLERCGGATKDDNQGGVEEVLRTISHVSQAQGYPERAERLALHTLATLYLSSQALVRDAALSELSAALGAHATPRPNPTNATDVLGPSEQKKLVATVTSLLGDPSASGRNASRAADAKFVRDWLAAASSPWRNRPFAQASDSINRRL